MNPIWRTFWIGMAVIAAMFTALILVTEPSKAQNGQLCGPEHEMLDMLYRRFQEFPVFRGDGTQGRKFILTRADGQGNWTLIIVAEGKACIADAGGRSRFDKGV